MANIKDLFEKNKDNKILADASLNKIGSGIESSNYVKSNIKDKERFIPRIDFSSASNFARYGLAEKYYSDSINYITSEYPYDGSQKEKIEWNLSSSYLDRHIFENEYPRTTGYINFGLDYGTVTFGSSTNLDESTKSEYIGFLGNTTTLPQNIDPNQPLSLRFDNLNLYNTASAGFSNLEINGSTGFGAEFWLKKDGWGITTESREQIILDIWNSSSVSPIGLFRVSALSASAAFNVSILSGAVTNTFTLGSKLPISGNTWNHYALMFKNNDSNLVGKLYHNGNLVDTDRSLTSINKITGSMMGNIGATTGYGDGGDSGEVDGAGFGKLSASLDEFRFWKTERSAEKIGRHWFTQVGGGTNSDITHAVTASTKYSYENPVDLGFYYKFNEGIFNSTATATKDSVILDYAGRVTNGNWTGYSVGGRSSGSAIVESSASLAEFKDPIIYSTHPDVVSLLKTKKEEGYQHDQENLANIYSSYPNWILEEDEGEQTGVLKDLTQIIASYFDTLQLQIDSLPSLKDVNYFSGSDKPYPFAETFINSLGMVSSDIFSNATDLEYLASRNDYKNFSSKLEDTKNKIYQNIYNNLVHIYKSKGTEKSFRNLIRCFGVDDELVNINLYGDNIEYEFRNNVDYRIVKKRYANFYEDNKFSATVFQQTSSTNSESRGYLSSSAEVFYRGNTYEAEAIFGSNLDEVHKNYIYTPFTSSAVFGCHSSGTAGTTWGSPDYGNFQVLAVRPSISSKDARFHLTGTAGGFFPLLTSSLFRNVYDDSRWNFAVKVKPTKYPLADGVTGSATGSYDVEFSGYNYVLDSLANSFTASSVIDGADARQFLISNKRFFAGAHRTNFTGSVVQNSSAKISSVRAWIDYLDDKSIQAHAQDVENFGTKYPHQNAYISQLSKSLGKNIVSIPQMETLALSWNFDTVTSSNASGQFVVEDVSSGSLSIADRYGWLGPIVKYQHTGIGYGFPANDAGSIDRRYVHSAKQQLPEVINSGDMVSIIDDTDNQMMTRDSRPIDYYFAFEKSMYGIISEQIINYFGTIVGFNNLIGEPVNRYRQEYKDLGKLRSLYFDRVKNTPDFEKFVEYFKWIDTALGLMLVQLAPATAGFSEKLRTMVESHVLERNKYWTKFPSLEMSSKDPEAGVYGINEMLYPWKSGHGGLDGPGNIYSTANVVWQNLVNLTTTAGGGIYKSAGGAGFNAWANGDPIGNNDAFTFTSAFTTTYDAYIGLHTSPGSISVENNMAVAFALRTGFANTVSAFVEGENQSANITTINLTDQYRIARGEFGEIFFQLSTDGGATFTTVYSPVLRWHGPLYPVIMVDSAAAGTAGIASGDIEQGSAKTSANERCFWWHNRADASITSYSSSVGNSTVNAQRNTIRLANDFRSGSGPTLAVSRGSTLTTTTYAGSAYAIRNFTKPYRLIVEELPEIHGGSNFSRGKKLDYAHTQIKTDPFGTTQIKLKLSASTIEEKACTDVIDPGAKKRLEGAFVSNQSTTALADVSKNYEGGRSSMFAPFSLFSSSITPSYLSNFRSNTQVANYHNDSYGEDNETPIQGPFTNAHVGGWQYRHQNINSGAADTTATRAEAWELSADSNYIQIASRNYDANLPRATMLRTDYAKRPVNIRNIKWGTDSQVAGNFRKNYEVLQTSKRTLNNRFFIKNEGFDPILDISPTFDDVVTFQLPRYDLTGTTKSIFVERFNAPGGPEVSSRGVLDLYAEEYAIYNSLNFRNLIVRNALDGWQTEYCGQFGIDSAQSATGSFGNRIYGPNEPEGFHQPRLQNYNTLASYHKVNRNGRRMLLPKEDFSREIEWIRRVNVTGSNFNTTLTTDGSIISSNPYVESDQPIAESGYFEHIANTGGDYAVGIDISGVRVNTNWDGAFGLYSPFWDFSLVMSKTGAAATVYEVDGSSPLASISFVAGDKFRILKEKNKVYYQKQLANTSEWVTFYTSLKEASGIYYPRLTVRVSNQVTLSNQRISNPQYDNWYIQHPIPQSELQYAWINDSYDKSKDQPLGYASNFTVPSGSSATTASAVQFVTASNWKFPGISSGELYPVNFTNMLSYLSASFLNPIDYKYEFTTLQERIPAGWYALENVVLSDNGQKLTYTGAGAWDGLAAGSIEIGENGYLEFEADQADAYIFIGLNDSPPGAPGLNAPPPTAWSDMEYSIELMPSGQLRAWEKYGEVFDQPSWYSAGDKFRITRSGITILFQHDEGTNGKVWTTFHRSTTPVSTVLFPDIAICCPGTPSISNIVVNNEATQTVRPGRGYYIGASGSVTASVLAVSGAINSHLNTLNGPYGYPSWKQIRTGETPIARYQRNNNILSIMEPPRLTELPNGNGLGNAAVFYNSRTDTQKQFIVPPVVFKYRALDTEHAVSERRGRTGQTDIVRTKLRSTYANNNCLFSHGPVQTIGSNNESIADWLNVPSIKTDMQIYDVMKADPSVWTNIYKINYKEIVYPRGANAGLTTARGRPEYAEAANGSIGGNGIFSASLSIGPNGIDHGPLYRRTFWRDAPKNRNRKATSAAPPQVSLPGADQQPTASNWFATTIANSQGFRDGQARSVWAFGSGPIVYPNWTAQGITSTFKGIISSSVVFPNDPSANGSDTGELNSINIRKMMGYMGGAPYRVDTSDERNTGSYAQNFYYYPTASCFYYHLPFVAGMQVYDKGPVTGACSEMTRGIKWRTAELSGKKPFFDSYEDYAADIRCLAKSYTVIPEFRASQHMPYYRDQNFKKQNDKFLTLDGAAITSSANEYSQPNGVRGFNEKFFNDYSNSDFQRYFGKFDVDSDNNLTNITLRCKGIKKLLPYQGFYPQERTLQMATLLSESLGPYIGGEAHRSVDQSVPPFLSTTSQPNSGALAMQALLQPYFAPGIMYNTIKSGIAVEWSAVTGSTLFTNTDALVTQAQATVLSGTANYKIPFRGLLNPLEWIPTTASAQSDDPGSGKLFFLAPSYVVPVASNPFATTPRGKPAAREIYVDMPEINGSRPSNSVMSLYTLAMHNFLAETPSFFLQGENFKKIQSKPEGSINLIEGQTYALDIYLNKSQDLLMMQDYYNGTRGVIENNAGFLSENGEIENGVDRRITSSFNGKYFGPAWSCGDGAGGSWLYRTTGTPVSQCFQKVLQFAGDPGYAPYTPPYFYGEDVIRVTYTAQEDDSPTTTGGTGFSIERMLNRIHGTSAAGTIQYYNTGREALFTRYSGTLNPLNAAGEAYPLGSSANLNAMKITASLDCFGITSGHIPGETRWVISPKFECPVLDFSDQPEEAGYGRGMWSGYGTIPNEKEITFGIKPPVGGPTAGSVSGVDPNIISMTEALFDTEPDENYKKVGEIANTKEISEAIVAIPYIEDQALARNVNQAILTKDSILGKYFFSLGSDELDSATRFRAFWQNKRQFGEAIPEDQASVWGSGGPVIDTSISELGLMMDKYVFPPELDFRTNQFHQSGDHVVPLITPTSGFIEPFVMYVMEFKHTLNKADLSDIWQGLMPKISTQAEQEISEASWPTGPLEFFGGKEIQPNIRWMVFKVKKKANWNYFKMTADESDDVIIPAVRQAEQLGASYNWPYDYFSLVELAELEVEDEFLIYPETETEGT